MGTNRAQHLDDIGALSWYGKQARLVAAEIIHPIKLTAHLLLDDPDSSLIELATTREDIRADHEGNEPVLPSTDRPAANDDQPRTVVALPDIATRRSRAAAGAPPPLAAVVMTAQGLRRAS